MAGILQHLGGNAANTDRGNFLGFQHDLNNTYNWQLPFAQGQGRTGTATTAGGLQDLGNAGGYYRKLASGDRPTALQAVAPETNAAIAQNDAQKRELASMGTARGGGAVGVNQQRDTDLMGKIDNMLFGARGAGAAGEAGVGQAEAGIGLGQTGQAIQGGAAAARTAAEGGQQALYARSQSNDIHRQTVDDIVKATEDIFSHIPGLDIPV